MIMGLASSAFGGKIICVSVGHAEGGASILAVGNKSLGGNMRKRNRAAKLLRLKLISLAVASCFSADLALANPTGPVVTNGQVSIIRNGNLLQITNSPSSIINWQSFSIGASEITRFIQQSNSSAVLNRVVTQNPSSILGALQSNGRVFLINPNGILFGAGSQIDVAGLVASTLRLSDADFLAGRLRFTEVPGAGSVINQGAINTAQGGQVYLVGPAVTNSGIITSPKGEVILAAGNSVELVAPGTPNLRVEITAPDNQAINLGQIVADAGRVGIYAGLINQSGTIRADSAVVTEDGKIVLKATKGVTLEAGSVTQASGARGGEISVLADGAVQVAGRLDASAPNGGDGGFIETSAAKLSIEPTAVITTDAPYGKTGTWLIDPPDFTIASAGGNITGADLATNLVSNNIVISSNDSMADGNGDIFVNDGVSWSNSNSLTLTALRNVNVNRSVTNAGSGAIALYAGWDGTSPAATPVVTPGVGDVNVGSATATAPTDVSTGGMLTVKAGDTLTVQGGSAGGAFARLTSGSGQTISAANITLMGGTGTFNSFADIRQASPGASQSITVTGGGTLSMQGGLSGLDNFARIRNDGTHQQINFPAGGAIVLTGGNGPNLSPDPADSANNFARIENRSLTGMQTINTGTITLNGGLTGADNFAGIQAAHQSITTSGDVTLVSGAGGGARIGAVGDTSPTDVALNVGGKLTLIGSSETDAAIGTNRMGGLTTAIAVTAGGDITLNPGDIPGSAVRIGSTDLAVAGGNISLTSTGGNILLNDGTSIRTLGDVTLNAPAPGKNITEGSDSVIQANKLTTLSNAGANLGGANQLAGFNATNTASGPVTLNNASPLLTVTGVSQVPTQPLSISQDGDLVLTGTITSGPQTFSATGNISVLPSSPAMVNAIGSQSITAGGGLIVQSSAAGSVQLSATGGQSINAGFVEVTAQDLPASIRNNGSGNQLITTSGMNDAGEGLALRTLGGVGATATIGQNVAGGQQVINVNNADRMTIDGAGGVALIFDNSGIQTVTITGATSMNALNMGSPGSLSASQIGGGGTQTVTAGLPGELGSITIRGKAAGSGGNSIIVSNAVPGGTQTVSTPGTLTVIGGTSPTSSEGAGIFANGIGGQQTINAGGIILQGGAFGNGNNAAIGASSGTQEINAGAGGLAMMGGGIGATNSSANITGATQTITSGGDVTLLSGSNTGSGVRIGGRGGAATHSPTDLALHAAGDVVLTSGSASGTAAVIGNSNVAAGQPSNISINAGGNVVLNAGSQSGARIGQSEDILGAGGDISITAGGNIQLNGTTQPARIRTLLGNVELHADGAGGMISANSNGFVHANQLTTTSSAGTSLPGPNQVAGFNATNVAAGDITFNNSGNLALMASNTAPGGKVTINNLVGDLSTSGRVAASGGGAADVALAAAGAVNIAHPVTATGTGDVALTGGAITVDDTSVVAGGSVSVAGASLDVEGMSSGALIHAGEGFNANLSGDLRVRSASVGGGFGGWAKILSGGPVNVSAHNVSLEGGKNLGGFAAITGGPVAVTTTADFSIAGGSGLGAFGWLLSNQDINLTVGGNLRLNSGSGFGSFARIQAGGSGSEITVRFPNLSSGGYFVNGVEGRISQGLTGFFTGIKPAQLGDTLIIKYGD